MKVYISADIEGITGIVSWSQCGRPDGTCYDYAFARRMMTHDVNAAIRGCRAAGASEVVVKDSHGNSKNLLLDELEEGTELVSGHGGGQDGMMAGIDDSFDAALLIGYHGMAGSLGGVMEHTITGGIHRLSINGLPCGEIGLSAGTAGIYGVPVVFASSDDVGCTEAVELVPGLKSCSVKSGLGRYMSRLLHPSQTGPAIEDGVRKALESLNRVAPHQWEEPTVVRIEFNRAEEADMCAKVLDVTRVDGYTVEAKRDSFKAAHKLIWALVNLSFQGIGSQS